MPESNRVPTAEQIMTRALVTFRPDTRIGDAIAVLLSKRISGAPVIDADAQLVGMLSEVDCLRMLSSDEFYAGDQEGMGRVENFMTRDCTTIPPETDLYGIAHYFLTRGLRRLPVVSNGVLIGQVSRRDVLGQIDQMGRRRAERKRYPDYREPEKLFVPRHTA